MSRTDELRGKGAQSRRSGGGGGTPFVDWGDSYAWIEGKVVDVWTGKYGDSVTLAVHYTSDGLKAKGKNEDGEKYQRRIEEGEEINVSLAYAALADTVTKADKGKLFHIAFEGWQDNQDGSNRYRVFEVLELGSREEGVGGGRQKEEAGGGYDDDDLPF